MKLLLSIIGFFIVLGLVELIPWYFARKKQKEIEDTRDKKY